MIIVVKVDPFESFTYYCLIRYYSRILLFILGSNNANQQSNNTSQQSKTTRADLYANFPSRSTISEVVQVPESLATFVADPKFQTTLLKVKEQSCINTITVNRTGNVAESIFINASTTEAALTARKLIEIHFKQQLKLITAEQKLLKVENDLFLAQGEMASGHMVEFSIDPSLIGLIIGKKGARIKQVKDESGVTTVNISDEGSILYTATLYSHAFYPKLIYLLRYML